MSGYLGDLSPIQEKSLDDLKEMVTAETLPDEVRGIKRELVITGQYDLSCTKSTIYDQ